MNTRKFSAVVHKEGKWYVANCPELGTVSQGKTIEDAMRNLKEATELYLEEFPMKGGSEYAFMTVFEVDPHVKKNVRVATC